ncbi:hypothetical protein OPKNFCMD_2673 [Methylobacterium crusticola]|uniref:Uncharacterized protein n=1 Tax=Methylobacterium crusticola TaxID=1697972 RepID=A0ABQ4QXM4_9HYPH|nr:hypothetical protein [Methylobacterium crusticola]GJD49937.1 hypothetical protein OPKNFCMD_2673 [Methylobacterium crusticola]
MATFPRRTGAALALSAALLGGGLAASTGASAGPLGSCKFHPCHGYRAWNPGYAAAAVAGGLALGAIAAAAAYAPTCYVARRPVVDAYGNTYLRRVRVCE